MNFACYTDWDQLPESATALFDQAKKDNIFFSRPWFESLASAAIPDDHSMLLACVVDGDRVMAMLPLLETPGVNTWYALRHGFTPIYSLLLADDDQERVISCFGEALSQLPLKGLLLEPVADDDDSLRALQKFLEAAGFDCDYTFRGYNWIYRLKGESYAEYMANRPAHLRNTIARKQRKLEREYGYDIRLFTGDEVPERMSDYNVVYNVSWKQNEIENADFLDHFIERFSREGWSRLAILYVKEQPVAAQLWFVHYGKASIFRLAYDKAWRAYSVGSILTSFLMEYVIDTDRVEEIDFLSGNDTYKQEWMSERRERFMLGCIKREKTTGRYERFIKSVSRVLRKPEARVRE